MKIIKVKTVMKSPVIQNTRSEAADDVWKHRLDLVH